jgi:hypothetical protein
VGATDGQHEQNGVEPQEGGGEGGGVAEALCGPGGQPDRREAAKPGERLQRPQPARSPQRDGRIARQGEQRPVGGVLEGPADEAENWVGGGFGGNVGVGIEAVQGTHPREGRVAEHVLGEQRGSQEQEQVGQHDRRPQRPRRQLPDAAQHEQVAAADDQHENLEGGAAQVRADSAERSRQPIRPAATVGGDVAGWRRGGVEDKYRQGTHQGHQAGGRERPHRLRRWTWARGRDGRPGACPCGRGWAGRLHVSILTARRSAGVQPGVYAV